MKRIPVAAGIVVASGLVGTTALVMGGGVSALLDSSLVKACEASIKMRLAAPSTYARFEIAERALPLTAEQWASLVKAEGDGATLIDFLGQEIRAGNVQPRLFSVDLTYDAENSFGAPLRKQVRCTYLADQGSPSKVSEYSVAIDGLTYTDWLGAQAALL